MKHKNVSKFLIEPDWNICGWTGGTDVRVQGKNNAFPAVIVYQGRLENNTGTHYN